MKIDYPVAFEECWRDYPRREPDNPKKPAFKAWQARVNEGVEISVLRAATQGYAQSVRYRRIEGTDKVMQAATFYGPNDRYEAFIPPEKPPVPVKTPKEISSPEELRVDGRAFIKDLIQSLSKSKKSPVVDIRVVDRD